MNILVDFTQIPLQKVGVGVYARETFREILINNKDNIYFFLLQNDDDELSEIFASATIIEVRSSLFRSFIFRFLMEQIYIPYLCLKYNIDIVHSLHYSFPLFCFGIKKIITIHDLTFFIYPKLHTFIKRYYFRIFTILAAKYGNTLICVSESTKKDLLKYIPIVKANITVVPLATEPSLNISQSEIDDLKRLYGIKKEYVLFIGTLEPRKNICNLIRAFGSTKIVLENYQLVIVGKKGWYYKDIFETILEMHIEQSVILTGFVSTKEKYTILSGASAFVYPSIYEGFGIPVLEAITYGIPVVTSNTSSLPDVAGDAAILIDPSNVQDISQSLKLVLFNENVRSKLKYNSMLRAQNFSWQKTAFQTYLIYNSSKLKK